MKDSFTGSKSLRVKGSNDSVIGKWLIGIGLGIGIVLVLLVQLTREKPSPSTSTLAAEGSSALAPTYSASKAVLGGIATQPEFSHEFAVKESIDVLGQQLVFSNPRGYCTPGSSEREVALMNMARLSLGEGARLIHSAVRCSELEEFRAGRRDFLDHWLQVQLIGSKGNFRRVELPREAFVSQLAGASPRVDSAELSERLRASLEDRNIRISDTEFKPIGRDGNAVYFSLRMSVIVDDFSRPVSGIGAITLLNALPLSVNVYEATGSQQSRDQLPIVQRELLRSLLSEN
ncbi:MAG: hypothetical protein O9256_00670 [Rhizobiaceae bacterium]|nr:hypothetical protein [Rhizobiaceae bacterium]